MSKSNDKIKVQKDTELISSILAGNKSDFEYIWIRYNKQIYAYVLKIVKNIDDADDILQDTFIKAYTAINSYNRAYPFPAWLYKIASNTCIDYFRRKRIRPIALGMMQHNQSSIQDLLPDTSTKVDINLSNSETRNHLYKAIDTLPDRYKDIIQLRHFEEMTYEEISKKMDVPLSTVKISLFRARKMLLAHLSGFDMSIEV